MRATIKALSSQDHSAVPPSNELMALQGRHDSHQAYLPTRLVFLDGVLDGSWDSACDDNVLNLVAYLCLGAIWCNLHCNSRTPTTQTSTSSSSGGSTPPDHPTIAARRTCGAQVLVPSSFRNGDHALHAEKGTSAVDIAADEKKKKEEEEEEEEKKGALEAVDGEDGMLSRLPPLIPRLLDCASGTSDSSTRSWALSALSSLLCHPPFRKHTAHDALPVLVRVSIFPSFLLHFDRSSYVF